MKLIHLSDLHLGKRVNEFSMLEDQQYILQQILSIIDTQEPDTVLLCGDIYDKPVPPAAAVALFDDFLVNLAKRNCKTFVISGNHDSPERIAFGGKLISASGVFLSPVYQKNITPISLSDSFGIVNFYMLPFIKPAHVRAQFPEIEIESYTDALQTAVDYLQVDTSVRNVLLTHQFVTGSERSDSEDISVGGTDNVAASVFRDFDYVALGHIHKPQNVTRETLRYCGTPLKYSFSEANQQKSVSVVTLAEKGNITLETIPLVPLRDMRKIKGTYMEVTAKSFYENFSLDDYFHVTLTDENDIPDAMNKLRTIYKNIMKLDYDNKRTQSNAKIESDTTIEQKSPLTLLEEFYALQNNQELSTEQRALVENLIQTIWEDNT